ncbi:MAG TPA: alkaline phosphatase family protein [Candidatus Saccharimonadales bacterium]|nr:alkaline phosphatase family protein [Candidatus Saccharimonadales bacterium]
MIHKYLRSAAALLTALTISAATPSVSWGNNQKDEAAQVDTKFPIKHIVVIFQENVSFDHYFATYPIATNPAHEPKFFGKVDTPRVNNLRAAGLLDENPNSTQPFRLDRTEAVTCDQDHDYADEQKAFNHGLMDKFPEEVGAGGPGCYDAGKGKGIVMGYYDGNTVTALWNYAQYFSMSDNSFGTNFGPSSVGAVNLISGNTGGAVLVPLAADGVTPGSPAGSIAGGLNSGALIGDPRPGFDNCLLTPVLGTAKSTRVTMSGKNIGDLLNKKSVTWGWFGGGFALTGKNPDGSLACGNATTVAQGLKSDYIPHHQPFQYYQSTANPNHLPYSNAANIGKTDRANHQYDLNDFWTALAEHRLPSVSFLKAKGAFDGHAGYSDPLNEQLFLVNTINALEQSPEWKDTAVIIAYDDSDGWYDHAMDPIVIQSDTTDDALSGPGACGVTAPGTVPGRCGYGPRLPLLVISPYSKQNYVDHRITDQSSILRFIEENWEVGRIGNGSTDTRAGTLDSFFDFDGPKAKKLILDPSTGLVLQQGHD